MTETDTIPRAPLLCEAILLAKHMDCLIEYYDGEVRFSYPTVGRAVQNVRLKDATRHTVCFLRKVQRARLGG